MKDFNFQNAALSVNVTYRTDTIQTTGNLTVLNITGLPGLSSPQPFRDKKLQTAFLKLPYTIEAFVAFAKANKLQLVMSDANGANSVTLVTKWIHQVASGASDSDSGS